MSSSHASGGSIRAPDRNAPLRTIRKPEETVCDVLDRLDASSLPRSPDRASSDYPFRPKSLRVRMTQPGGTQAYDYKVYGRCISAIGISFLHGGYVHQRTHCTMQLVTPYGSWNEVAGQVIRCRFVEANIHEVVVAFDQTIDPAQYCAEAVQRHFLVVDDDPFALRVASTHLSHLGVKVESATNGVDALELAGKTVYDVILLDIVMPGMTGLQVVETLQERRYTGLIIALTGLTQQEDRERCLAAGCDRYIPKPCTRESLNELLSSLQKEPLFSTLHEDAEMKDLIREYVADLRKRARALQEAVAHEHIDDLVQVLRALKGDAASHGFEIISESAAQLESIILADKAAPNIHAPFRELVEFCLQAQAPTGAVSPETTD